MKATKRLTEDQVRVLESSFDFTKKLEPERKQQLSRELGIPPRQVAIWYQNKRARWKNQSLEHDYNFLQLQLEATLMETKHLQKEVQELRAELRKVRAQHPHPHYYSSSEDVGNSSTSNHDGHGLYCFGEQVDQMYAAACMMGADLGLFASKNIY